jgi:diguanylate cyclase (GGDEF)-like protein
MFFVPQLSPVLIYSIFCCIALVCLGAIWFFAAYSALFASLLFILLFGILLASVMRKYKRQLYSLQYTNQHSAYLLSLHITALALMERLNLDDLLAYIVQSPAKLTNEADVFISLLDSTGESLITKAGTGCFKENIGSNVLLTDEIGGKVYKTGGAVVLNYIDDSLTSAYLQEGFKALAVVPLKSAQQVIGLIGLGYYKETLLGQLELEFLEGLAALASSAVDNARLYEKVQHELKERKLIEENLKYISIHDPLTGLYNRIYFEEEMRRLSSGRFDPVGIIVCDVDGLKLVNDSLGHIPGDELLQAAAEVIQNCFRDNDVISRIGGDEFAILLPQADLMFLEKAYQRIMGAVIEYNTNSTGFLLSISVGFACKDALDINLQEVFQLADDAMYRQKMQNRNNTREALLQSIRILLNTKNFSAGEDNARLYNLVNGLAKRAGLLSMQELNALRLLVEFHDIGKVGIPDGILAKSQPLTTMEFSEIRRHSEIGYRIAKVLPELAPIADCILKHHEWWNGQGYPLGLAGEEIPLACRIWAIADAYDAMISHRPYRAKLTNEAAIAELIRGAGSQFDPELVKLFVKMIQEQK